MSGEICNSKKDLTGHSLGHFRDDVFTGLVTQPTESKH